MREVMGIKLYDLRETAGILKITERTLREYLKAGKMKGVKIGGVWEISEENLISFLKGESTSEKGESASE